MNLSPIFLRSDEKDEHDSHIIFISHLYFIFEKILTQLEQDHHK